MSCCLTRSKVTWRAWRRPGVILQHHAASHDPRSPANAKNFCSYFMAQCGAVCSVNWWTVICLSIRLIHNSTALIYAIFLSLKSILYTSWMKPSLLDVLTLPPPCGDGGNYITTFISTAQQKKNWPSSQTTEVMQRWSRLCHCIFTAKLFSFVIFATFFFFTYFYIYLI